jgi:hypothetical protein
LPIFCNSIIIKKLANFTYPANFNFTIINPRINKIDFGSFEYGSDDINNITLTVIPEWCTNEENKTSNLPVQIQNSIAATDGQQSNDPPKTTSSSPYSDLNPNLSGITNSAAVDDDSFRRASEGELQANYDKFIKNNT